MNKVFLMVLIAIVSAGFETQAIASDRKLAKNPVNAKQVIGFSLDGFKDVKFGMSRSELESLGVSCGGEFYCTNGNPSYTLLGREAIVSVNLKNNKVISIHVDIKSMITKEVIATFKKSLGTPIYSEFDIGFGRRGVYSWISSNKTSVNVSTLLELNKSDTPAIFYEDEEGTSLRIKNATEFVMKTLKDNAPPDSKDF
jgi:hypothetical protein